jgi:hypothetical protein
MSLNKWERIQAVKALGLNTEESVLIKDIELNAGQNQFIKNHEMFSLRTFGGNGNGAHPHYPVINQQKLLNELLLLTEKGYSCIVATCIDPKDAEFAGCAYKKGGHVIFEIASGPGTVRRVTHEGKIDRRIKAKLTQTTGDRRLDCALMAIKDTPIENCIFEFSWYKNPVGRKKHRLIFWEVTGADSMETIPLEGGGVLKI